MTRPLVLKFGGELLEDPRAPCRRRRRDCAAIAAAGAPLVVVHGGGKEIDAALKSAGIEKRQVDGLRITDEATLDVVVARAGGHGEHAVRRRAERRRRRRGRADGRRRAVADSSTRAPPHRTVDGRIVDLGCVGVPAAGADMQVAATLSAAGFVPVVACIGLGADGRLLNVNADTFAGHLAARLGARRLVIAGTTPGVLDAAGTTLPVLDAEAIARLVGDGTATAGMIAKLRACEHALAGGVDDVVIVDGRERAALERRGGQRGSAGVGDADCVRMVTA